MSEAPGGGNGQTWAQNEIPASRAAQKCSQVAFGRGTARDIAPVSVTR